MNLKLKNLVAALAARDMDWFRYFELIRTLTMEELREDAGTFDNSDDSGTDSDIQSVRPLNRREEGKYET
jgi:hypothetical protein